MGGSTMSNICSFSPLYTAYSYGCAPCSEEEIELEITRYLFTRALSVYEIEMPDKWDANYFMYTLFGIGYIGVAYTLKYGWIPQRCSLDGMGLWESPTRVMINNTFIQSTHTIGVDAAVVKTFGDYKGIAPLVATFAKKIAKILFDVSINLDNTKLAYFFFAANEKQAKSYKKVLDELLNGQRGVFAKDSMKNSIEDSTIVMQNLKNTYIVSDLLEDYVKVMRQFDSFFGISNSNIEKKERLISDEVNANNQETRSIPEQIVKNVTEGFNELYRISNIRCKITYKGGDAYV